MRPSRGSASSAPTRTGPATTSSDRPWGAHEYDGMAGLPADAHRYGDGGHPAGLNCSIGILAALKGRERTGVGERIDVALVDSVVSAMETIIQLYLVEGRIPGGSATATSSSPLTTPSPLRTVGSSSGSAAGGLEAVLQGHGSRGSAGGFHPETNRDRVRVCPPEGHRHAMDVEAKSREMVSHLMSSAFPARRS